MTRQPVYLAHPGTVEQAFRAVRRCPTHWLNQYHGKVIRQFVKRDILTRKRRRAAGVQPCDLIVREAAEVTVARAARAERRWARQRASR